MPSGCWNRTAVPPAAGVASGTLRLPRTSSVQDRSIPACGHEQREHYFVEELTFAHADSILAMLRELCPQMVDGLLPVWVPNLSYRLLLLQRPDEPALMRELPRICGCTAPGTT